MPQSSSFAREAAEAPDTPFDVSLRPPVFSEFSGQAKVRERLELMVKAAQQRGDVLDHILLSGPPGLGKTTLAYIVAHAMGVNIKSTSGPMIEKAGDLAGLLTTIERGDILFIDEIHRLQPAIEEYLYPAMEDYKLDIIIDRPERAAEPAEVYPHGRDNALRDDFIPVAVAIRHDQPARLLHGGGTPTDPATERRIARDRNG